MIDPTIEYPSSVPGGYYAPGLLIKWTPAPWLEILGGSFDANQDWQRIGDNLFNVGQLTILPNVRGRAGAYRFFVWHNQMPRTQWLDPSQTNASSYGFGVSFDQKIYDNITPFMRYGWRSPDVFDAPASVSGGYTTLLGQAWSLGIQFGGALWRRENDAVGLAFGQVLPSADYKTANPLLHASAESHCEAYWRIQVFESLSISPDFQYIIGPFGKDAPENPQNIAVLGVRSQADF